MSINEAAAVLGLSASSLRRYVAAKRIKTSKIGKSHTIEGESLKAFFLTVWAEGEDWDKFKESRKSLIPSDIFNQLP